MTKTVLIIILSTAALFAAVSCKKQQAPPVVSLTAPADGSKYNVGDTINVSGQVTDANQLQSVIINLINDQFQPMSQSISLGTGKSSFSFNTSLVINNIELTSGTYYVNLTASDGVNSASDYSMIYLTALPMQRKGIYIVTGSDNNWTYVSSVDSAHNIAPMLTLSGDYSSAAISSIYNQLYVCGKYSGGFNAISLVTNSNAWSIQAHITSAPFFEAMSYANGISYVSYYNGNITGYDNIQSTRFVATAQGAYYPVNIFYSNGCVFVEHHEISGNGEKLVAYYSTGTSFQQVPLDAKPVQMFTIDQYDMILLGNNAQGAIEVYNYQNNVIHALYTCDSVNDAVQLDANNYILALTSGIYEYNYLNNSLSSFIPRINASSIVYDDANNELIVASGNTLSDYDAGGNGLKYAVTVTETVKKVLLLFNK